MRDTLSPIHAALVAAGVPFAGLAGGMTEVHPTASPATFFRVGETLYRVDWDDAPAADTIALAAATLGTALGAPGTVTVVDP